MVESDTGFSIDTKVPDTTPFNALIPKLGCTLETSETVRHSKSHLHPINVNDFELLASATSTNFYCSKDRSFFYQTGDIVNFNQSDGN